MTKRATEGSKTPANGPTKRASLQWRVVARWLADEIAKRPRKALCLAVFVFVLTVALLSTGYVLPGGDARDYYNLTWALAVDQTFDLTHTPFRIDESNLNLAVDGTRHTKYALGQSLAQVPFSYVGNLVAPFRNPASAFVEMLSLKLTPAVLAAGTAALLFLLLSDVLAFGMRSAVATALLYSFATQALPYAKSNFSEGLQAFLLLLCLYALMRPMRHASIIVAAFAFAGLVLTKPNMGLLLPVFLVLFVRGGTHKLSPWWTWAIAILVSIGGCWLLLYYNVMRNDALFDFGYTANHYKLAPTLPLIVSNFGRLIASSDKSLFLYNPILLCAIPGVVLLRRHRYTSYVGAIVLILVVYYCNHGGRFSGSWGQRYLIPVIVLLMPFVAATMAWILERSNQWQRVGFLGVFVLLTAASIYLNALGTIYYRYAGVQFCGVYNHEARILSLPSCEERSAGYRISTYHYLLWNDHGRGQRIWPEFGWLDEIYEPSVATRVLSNPYLNRRWVTTDLMFFSDRALNRFRSARPLRSWLWLQLVLAGCLLAIGLSKAPTGRVSTKCVG